MKQLICCFIKVQPARRETSDCFSSPPELADAKVFSQPAGCDQRLWSHLPIRSAPCLCATGARRLWNLRFFEKNRVKLSSFCCARAKLPRKYTQARDMRANGSPPRKRRDDAPPRLASRLSLARHARKWISALQAAGRRASATCVQAQPGDAPPRLASRLSLVIYRHKNGRRLRRRRPR